MFDPETTLKLFKSIFIAWLVGIPLGGLIVALKASWRDSDSNEHRVETNEEE